MTEPSQCGESPEDLTLCPLQTQKTPLWRRKTFWGMASGLCLGLGGSLVYGWFYLQQELPTRVEAELANFLNRPVKLGEMKYVTLNKVSFSETEILPIGDDSAKVSMKALTINYNPWVYLSKGKLKIKVTAIEPNLYIEQSQQGEWLQTPFDRLGENHPVNLQSLTWKNATVNLVFQSHNGELQPQIELEKNNGQLFVNSQFTSIDFNIDSQIQQGELRVSGSANLPQQIAKFAIQGTHLPVRELQQAIALPLELQSGTIHTNLTLHSTYQQLPQIRGTATLNQVTASLPQLSQPLSQVQGHLLFRGEEIYFDQVTGNLNKIKGTITGNLHPQKGLDVKVRTEPIAISQIVQSLALPKVSFPLNGEIKNLVQIKGNPLNPIINVDSIATKPIQIDRLTLNQFQANLDVHQTNVRVNQFIAKPTVGGKIQGQGLINLDTIKSGEQIITQGTNYGFEISLENLAANTLLAGYNQTLPLETNLIAANAIVKGTFQQTDSLTIQGEGNLTVAKGRVKVEQFYYDQQTWSANANLSDISLQALPISHNKIQSSDHLNGQFILRGNSEKIDINNIDLQGTSTLTFAGGIIRGTQINLSQGNWWGIFSFDQLQAQQILPQMSSSLQGKLQGKVAAKGTVDDILTSLEATGNGTLTLANGTIKSQEFSLSQGKWKTIINMDSLPLMEIFPQLPDFAKGNFSGQFQLIGQVDNIIPSLEGKGRGNIALTQGGINLNSLKISQGKFMGEVNPYQLELSAISQQLKGNLNGNITLVGNLENLNPSTITATGNVSLSQGIGIINHPLTTLFNWQNQQLEIVQATGNNFEGKGTIRVDSDRLISDPDNAIQSINLRVSASDIHLNQFPLPDTINPNDYSGKAEFKGTIDGEIKQPKLNGEIALINLTLPALAFEKALEGQITSNSQGIQLILAGLNDKIDLKLDQNYQPLTVSLRQQNLEIEGIKQENQLYIESQNLPLSLVKQLLAIKKPSLSQLSDHITGNVSGNFTINLDDFSVIGKKVTIQQPQLDWVTGEKLTSDLHYINNQLMLRNSQLITANSYYDFDANINLVDSQPTIEANIEISQGTIEDILTTFHLFELSDFTRRLNAPQYGKAADLYADPDTVAEAGVSQGNLKEQLETFQKVLEEIEDKKQLESETNKIPPLSDLQGQVTGTLALKTTPNSNIEASFNLLGSQWKWGEWELDTLQLQGNWQNETLILKPLELRLGQSFLAIEGQFSEKYQKGQLQIYNVPLTPFSSLVNVSNDWPIEGFINASISLEGSRYNPSAKGIITLDNLTLYQGELRQTTGTFDYQNSKLNFTVNSIFDNQADAILIAGTLPYQLPFANYKPTDEEFEINLRIQNQGFALLNILTQEQLIWENGKGDINLKVKGNINPKTQQIRQIDGIGQITIENGILQSSLIPEKPLTQVNGLIDLTLDRIEVRELTGQFSDGKISLLGSLPLRQPLPDINPLTLTLNNLAFNFPNFYEGGVKGQLDITGTISKPKIGGNIQLYDGEILLSDTLISQQQTQTVNCTVDQSSNASLSQSQKIDVNKPNYILSQGKTPTIQDNLSPENTANSDCKPAEFAQFNQLQLSLEENIRILRHPILSFTATGNIMLEGTVNNPQPSGQINLTRGQVNLLASQLQLLGNNNTVRFFPKRGLDPYLNLNLVTSATETTQNTVRRDPLSSEIDDPFTANRNSLQTVRVQAKVEGYASQLEDVISLNSDPKRSKREIFVLLGGSLANLENQENTTIGLANLAGSAVLGTVPGEIGSALGLSEFRIFPTQIISEESRISSSQLGIAAEAGLDLTDDISLSILKILNTNQAPQLGIRYRLNDKILLRGSSNFDDDSRGVIEYERRF
ncbi:MAG: translocation/assembly module TamB domain-containing protein [Microcystaceae cyanobacterium]